jgi:hypothetical protein
MKSSILQGFIRDWLAVRGLAPQTVELDVWQFPIPKDLQERFGRDELTFSFSRRAITKNPKSELATVGNPVFDRLLSVAREEGRIGIAYTKPSSPAPRPPASDKLGEIDGARLGHPESVYQGIYHFVFTIAYPSIETADEMEVVSVDGGSLDIWAQTPDLSVLWTGLEPEPRKGRSELPPLPIPPKLLDAALHAFERRMRRRIKKVEQASQERLEEETASIKIYYEQLIEEARNQSRRWSTRLEDREDRIRWLQLEWKRRTEEATEFWRPNVTARLVALGIQMQPRVAYRITRHGGSKAKGAASRQRPTTRVWDEATRAFLLPYCEECGRIGLEEPHLHPTGGFLCPACAARPKPVIKVPGGFATLTEAGADR